MEKRLKMYLKYMGENLEHPLDSQRCRDLKADLLFQIGFFQHERLIHLLVTLCFAIMTVIVMLFSFFRQDILILLFLLLLLLLLMPYIRHYFILENGVQKLYTFYDRLCDEERTKK